MSARVREGPADCIGIGGVTAALREVRGHGAPGLSELVTGVMWSKGDVGAQWMLDLCSGVVDEGYVLEELGVRCGAASLQGK